MLDRQINHENEELLAYRHHIKKREHENAQFEGQIRSMRIHVQQVKEEIVAVQQDLDATRSHAPDEGMMFEKELIHEFRNVTKSVDDLVQDLCSWFYPYTDKAPSESRTREITERFRGEEGRKDVDMFLACAVHTDMPMKPIAEALFNYYLCSSLMANVFEPFLPGKRNEDTAIFLSMQSKVQKMESQDNNGRWRALTYKTALEPRHEAWCMDAATTFLQRLSHILTVLASTDMSETGFSEVHRRTVAIFNHAARFKDMAMTRCTEVDFWVYLPFGNTDITTFSINETMTSKKPSKKVVLGVGMGIEIFRYADKGSTGRFREAYCPVLSSVIGDQSQLFVRPSRSILSFF